MSTTIQPKVPEPTLPSDPRDSESLAAKITRYGSPEFSEELVQRFHRAKRQALQERETLNRLTHPVDATRDLK